MNADAKLTNRESEFAELAAWGATKKDIAKRCFVSIRTVENTFRNIFRKTGVTKINELSAWWFCVRYDISFDLSPLKNKIAAIVILVMLLPSNNATAQSIRIRQPQRRTLTLRSRTSSARRRSDYEAAFYLPIN